MNTFEVFSIIYSNGIGCYSMFILPKNSLSCLFPHFASDESVYIYSNYCVDRDHNYLYEEQHR